MRVTLRPVLNGLIVCGLAIAAWPLGQTVYGIWNQRTLAAQFERSKPPQSSRNQTQRANQTAPTRLASDSLSSGSPTLATSARLSKRPRRAPWPLTKLSIPDIGLQTFVVQGMDAAALRRGPGHDINSSLPGSGNCVIAGHRNLYGSFFYRLDELLPGALITLENRDGKWNYVVDSTFTTPETDLTVLKTPPPGATPILTLTTCTLPHTSNRIILKASLIQP